MPTQKGYIGKVISSAGLKEAITTGSLAESATPLKISFEGGRDAFLDLSYPVASSWAKTIAYLQDNNRPVFVDIDDDTNYIIRLLVPSAERVWRILPASEDIVYVSFSTANPRHYLRRSHSDFQQMLDDLQAALDSDTQVLVTATHPDYEIIDVRPVPASFGPNEEAAPLTPGPPPPPPGPPPPPVTLARATDLFNQMAALSCIPCASLTPCITFRYPYNGCWIRAHIMCYLMMDQGESPEKVWIESSGCDLVALSSNVPECQVEWCWHVAPTLMVTQPDASVIKMVIDPSLSNAPLSTGDWQALMTDPASTLTYTDWTNYFQSGGTATRAQAETDMQSFRNQLDTMCSTYGPSPYACPIVKKSFFIVDRSTISKDEIDAILLLNNPAVIEAAFYVVVDGFTPNELGITAATLVGIPNIVPALSHLPAFAQMSIAVMAPIALEDPTHLVRRQRITWKYQISFTGTAGFTIDLREIDLSATIATVAATAKLYLIRQANPYEVDGATSWLSTDLRVFQIKTNESRFNKTMLLDAPDFITTVIQNLNTNNAAGQTFENLPTGQQDSILELSETVAGVRVFNFAIAKVRYRSTAITATGVRVFFRLFPASSTSLEYNQGTTYRRFTQGGAVKPLLGIINTEAVTIPCFAAARVDSSVVSMETQLDDANVQPIPPDATGHEVVRYFGCWLDFNQTAAQFPFNPPAPVDGPYAAATRKSVQEHVRNEHQCLVSEIAFDLTPIPSAASPAVSDKLAQRNLAIVESDNPGALASHRIPHTFEIKPTRVKAGSAEMPDELMIDWGNTPVGSTATLYLPGASSNEIMDMAIKLYRTHTLVRIDAHTVQCKTGGNTFIPIPYGSGSNYAGMISVDLPDNVKKGQHFTIVVHQVTNISREGVLTHAAAGVAALQGRRILGSFQLSIPVTVKENMLVHEVRLLANLRWIQRSIPANNRWYPVFNRYVKQIADRVDALGGNAGDVAASPNDGLVPGSKNCLLYGILIMLLLAALIIVSGAITGTIRTILVAAIAAIILGLGYYWISTCRPSICRRFKTIFFGVGAGTVVLALLWLADVVSPQMKGVLITGGIVTVITGLVCWVRGCFRK